MKPVRLACAPRASELRVGGVQILYMRGLKRALTHGLDAGASFRPGTTLSGRNNSQFELITSPYPRRSQFTTKSTKADAAGIAASPGSDEYRMAALMAKAAGRMLGSPSRRPCCPGRTRSRSLDTMLTGTVPVRANLSSWLTSPGVPPRQNSCRPDRFLSL